VGRGVGAGLGVGVVVLVLAGCAGTDAGQPPAASRASSAGTATSSSTARAPGTDPLVRPPQSVTLPMAPGTEATRRPPQSVPVPPPPAGADRPVRPPASVPLPLAPVTGLALVHVPASPADLAATIAAAHRRIRAGGAGVPEAGRDLQRALRALARTPAWLDEVDRAIPDDVRVAWGSDLAIQRALVANPPRSGEAPSPTIPAWTVRPPLPPEVLRAHYAEAEARTGIGWPWLAAINLIETRMGRIVGVSSAGAQGPMQFLPSTWAECCVGDIADDRDAILGAATYLAQSGGPADMRAAVWQYNPNELYVAMVTAYAEAMAADPRAYEGFHAYEVIVRTAAGDIRLPDGFAAAEPVDAAAYLAINPQDRASVP
jgi:hypothetical protein